MNPDLVLLLFLLTVRNDATDHFYRQAIAAVLVYCSLHETLGGILGLSTT